MTISRRHLICGTTSGICLLAGCSLLSENVADISVFNKTNREVSAQISVVRISDGNQLIDDSLTLSPEADDSSDSKQYTEVVSGSETAEIHLTVRNGLEGTYEFTDEEETDAKGVYIAIESNSVQFSEVVA